MHNRFVDVQVEVSSPAKSMQRMMCNHGISVRFSPLFALFVLISSALPAAAVWQDDPDDPFALNDTTVQQPAQAAGVEPPDETELDRSLSEGVRLIILSVRNSNPATTIDLARAIKSMLNIRQYDEARRYLIQLMNLNATDAEIYELFQQMGADFFLEMSDQPKLLPEARQFANQVFETSRNQAYAPERINDLIKQLSSEDRFVRSDAFRKLRRLGAPAAAAMLNVCADPNRRKEFPFVQSALKNLDNSGLLPLIGAARADGTVVQAVAVGALTNIESELAADPLYRASISSSVPDSVQAIAAEFVAQRGLTTPDQIKQQIYQRANDYLDGRVALPTDSRGETVIWNWNSIQQKLLPTRFAAETAAPILAVDLARDVYRLDKSNPAFRQLQLLAVLDATKRILGPNRFIMSEEISPFIQNVTVHEIDQTLGESLDRELLPAAIGAAELAGQLGDVSMLVTTDGTPANLVRAMLSGQRHLQFAAAESIARFDPQSAFPGCSYFARLMTFFANSQAASSGLVLHPRSDMAQTLASSVSQSGLVGRTVNTPLELFEALNSNPDVALVLVTDASSNPDCQELVQQIRRNWLASRLPVGLLTRSFDRERRAELVLDDDSLTWVMPLTSNPSLVFSQIQRLRDFQKPWPVSEVQRDQHAQFALQWLAKTLSNPDKYRFYHLSCFRDELVQLVQTRGSYSEKSAILTALGTPASQRSLAAVASESAIPIEERQAYADAFTHSVSSNGLLLTTDEIQRQYDLYNASGSQPEDSREILGKILDAIESKVRN